MTHDDAQKQATRPTLDVANAARSRANRDRAKALLAVAGGTVEVSEIVSRAVDEPYLRRIGLRQLLMSQDGWGEARAEALIRRVAAVCRVDIRTRSDMLNIRIAWLLDERTGGKRLAALSDALCDSRQRCLPPWGGFPHHPYTDWTTARKENR